MQIYWYELIYRGISPGAFPRGAKATEHTHVNERGFNFGAVAYDRKLTSKEVSDYEIKETSKVRELHDYEKV